MENADFQSRLAAGDMTAFGEVWEKYYKMLYELAYHIVRNPDDASDAVQDVFVKLCSRPDVRCNITDFKGYLAACVRNRCIYLLRQRQSQLRRDGAYDATKRQNALVDAIAAFDNTTSKHRDFVVSEMLKALPRKRRGVIQLYYFEGLSYQEIGERLNITRDTVKTQLRLARNYFHGLKHLLYFLLCWVLFF